LTIRNHRHEAKLIRPAILLVLLLLAQLTLGVLTVLMKKPADVASAHVAVGALLLVTCFVLMVRSSRVQTMPGRASLPASRGSARASPSPGALEQPGLIPT
jgi:cytochrome c oxidase assembly protein subunit 15